MNKYLQTIKMLALVAPMALTAFAANAELSITAVNPADGSTLKQFDKLEVTTTDNSQVQYGNFVLGVPDEGTYVTSGEIRNIDGILVWESSGLVENLMFKGTDYPCVIKLAATEEDYLQGIYLAETTVTYHGDSEGFKFSDVKYIGVDPANESEVVERRDFSGTLTFSGPAYLNNGVDCGINAGMGMGFEPFKSLTPNADNTEWTFVVGLDFLEQQQNSFDLSFMPRDAEGNVIEGTAGEGATSYIALQYKCFFGSPAVVVTPKAGTYGKLETITFKCSKNIGPSYIVSQVPTIIDPMETVICELGMLEQVDKNTVRMTVINPETKRPMYLTAPDNYTLVVPSQYFCIGEQFDGGYNGTIRVEYVIDGSENIPGLLYVEPSDGSEVSTLKTISIDFEGMVGENPNFDGQAEILNADNEVVAVATKDDIKYNTRISNVTVTFSEEVDEPGVYTVHFPQGMITLYGREDSPEMTFTYTVLGKEDETKQLWYAVVDPAPDSNSTSLKDFTITFPNAKNKLQTWGFNVALSCKDPLVNATTLVDIQDGDQFNSADATVKFSFDREYTAPGVYTLTIPSYSLWVGDEYFPEIKFVYTIVDSAVGTVASDDVKANVYTIDGKCIMTNASASDLNNLPRGIYIHNGRKVAVVR